MRKSFRPAALAATALLAAVTAPAWADVKAGVDDWNRGEYKKAIDEWRPAALAGDADAQFNLGQAYKLGRGVPVDLPVAEGWYRKAALQGHQQAGDNYGLALFQEGKRGDAVPWLEKSVARGEPRAQLVLGTMLYNGDGVARDWPRAYALLVRSQASGLPQAAQVLAQMDQYIPTDDRQKGLVLARQYEAQAQQPQLPPEIAGQGGGAPMQGTNLPPSSYAGGPPVAAPPPPPHRTPPVQAPPPPPRAVATAGGWRLQLGAFRDEGNARALWQSLQPRVAGLAPLQPILVHAGALTRLQAGPVATGAAASKLCAAVKATGTACLPVAP